VDALDTAANGKLTLPCYNESKSTSPPPADGFP